MTSKFPVKKTEPSPFGLSNERFVFGMDDKIDFVDFSIIFQIGKSTFRCRFVENGNAQGVEWHLKNHVDKIVREALNIISL